MSSKKDCKKELKEIEERKADGLAADQTLVQKEIGANCVIHRFIRRDHWDVEHDRCYGQAFEDPSLDFHVKSSPHNVLDKPGKIVVASRELFIC